MLLRLERLLDAFGNVLMWLAGIAMTMMMLQIGADVLSKYIFNKPVIATLEIVTWYYMVATVFLPLVYIQVHKKHLMVELFTMRWSERRVGVLEGLIGLVGSVYIGTLAVLTFLHAIEQTEAGEIQDATFFDLPVWPSRWLLPISVAAMAVVSLLQGIRDLRYGLTGQGEPVRVAKGGMEMPVEEA